MTKAGYFAFRLNDADRDSLRIIANARVLNLEQRGVMARIMHDALTFYAHRFITRREIMKPTRADPMHLCPYGEHTWEWNPQREAWRCASCGMYDRSEDSHIKPCVRCGGEVDADATMCETCINELAAEEREA